MRSIQASGTAGTLQRRATREGMPEPPGPVYSAPHHAPSSSVWPSPLVASRSWLVLARRRGRRRATPFDEYQQRGWVWMYLAAFGFGFQTSLTPCVYPMIPITLGIFGARGKNVTRGRALALATAYVVGMGLTYATLGVIIALVGGQFGTLLVEPVRRRPDRAAVRRARGVDVRRVRAQPAGVVAGAAQPGRRHGLPRRVRDGHGRRPDRRAVHRPVPARPAHVRRDHAQRRRRRLAAVRLRARHGRAVLGARGVRDVAAQERPLDGVGEVGRRHPAAARRRSTSCGRSCRSCATSASPETWFLARRRSRSSSSASRSARSTCRSTAPRARSCARASASLLVLAGVFGVWSYSLAPKQQLPWVRRRGGRVRAGARREARA